MDELVTFRMNDLREWGRVDEVLLCIPAVISMYVARQILFSSFV